MVYIYFANAYTFIYINRCYTSNLIQEHNVVCQSMTFLLFPYLGNELKK